MGCIMLKTFCNFKLKFLDKQKMNTCGENSTSYESKLKSILQSTKISEDQYDGLTKAIIENGIDGLKNYKDDIIPKDFKYILSALESMTIDEKNYDFQDFIEQYLKTFKVPTDLHEGIIETYVSTLIESIEKIEIIDSNQKDMIAKALNKSNKGSSNSYESFETIEKFFKSFLDSFTKRLNDNLIDRIIDLSIDCFIKVLELERFSEYILPRVMKIIQNALNIENRLKSITEEDKNLQNKSIENILITQNETKLVGTKHSDIKPVNFSQIKARLSKIPTCLEKCVMTLIFHISFKSIADTSIFEEHKISDQHSFEKLDEIIENELNLTKERLLIEESNNEELKQKFTLIDNKITDKNWENSLNNLKNFLKEIRPFDINELEFLISKSTQASKLIKGRDVIMLFGKTGTGKSTTIHFLAGSKLEAKKIEIEHGKYIDHILPVSSDKNEALKSVISSYKAESETRYINPIVVNLRDIGGREDKDVIICDTPGIGDTAGAEVDIANGIGIVDAIKESRSVKPVFLLSGLRIGDRGEGIRELAHFLC